MLEKRNYENMLGICGITMGLLVIVIIVAFRLIYGNVENFGHNNYYDTLYNALLVLTNLILGIWLILSGYNMRKTKNIAGILTMTLGFIAIFIPSLIIGFLIMLEGNMKLYYLTEQIPTYLSGLFLIIAGILALSANINDRKYELWGGILGIVLGGIYLVFWLETGFYSILVGYGFIFIGLWILINGIFLMLEPRNIDLTRSHKMAQDLKTGSEPLKTIKMNIPLLIIISIVLALPFIFLYIDLSGSMTFRYDDVNFLLEYSNCHVHPDIAGKTIINFNDKYEWESNIQIICFNKYNGTLDDLINNSVSLDMAGGSEISEIKSNRSITVDGVTAQEITTIHYYSHQGNSLNTHVFFEKNGKLFYIRYHGDNEFEFNAHKADFYKILNSFNVK